MEELRSGRDNRIYATTSRRQFEFGLFAVRLNRAEPIDYTEDTEKCGVSGLMHRGSDLCLVVAAQGLIPIREFDQRWARPAAGGRLKTLQAATDCSITAVGSKTIHELFGSHLRAPASESDRPAKAGSAWMNG